MRPSKGIPAAMDRSNRKLAVFLALLVSLNIVLRWRRYHYQGRIGARYGLPMLTADMQQTLPAPVGTLLEQLQHGGDFTLFAPSMEAYNAWMAQQAGTSDGLKDRIHSLLADHILDEVLLLDEVPDRGISVTASSGKKIEVRHGVDGALVMNGIVSKQCNLEKGGGIVHIIDGVLFFSQQSLAKQDQLLHVGQPQGDDGVDRYTCSGRGSIAPGRGCRCAALYRGPQCKDVTATKAWQDTANGYFGSLILSQAHLLRMTEIKAITPGKELSILKSISPAMREQLSRILPDRDIVSNTQFRSCALVGGSGILMRYEAGAEIDGHEMVLRFNSAPTKGYQEHVGSRTTYRVCNGEHLNFKEGNETVIHHLKARSFLRKLMLYTALGKAPPLVFDPDFTSYVASMLSFIPSSGYFAIMMALQVCHQISLYGFFVSDRHGARHHYFNTETPSNAKRDDTEYHVTAALARSGVLKFREPCIVECHESQTACQECLGDIPLEELAALERWSQEQVQYNSEREAALAESRKWDWGVEETLAFSETEGVVRKSPRPLKAAKPDSGPSTAQRQHGKSSSAGAEKPRRNRGGIHLRKEA
mmetsp:Transcript_29231/g.82481  ORF Transcript_29231/g.82481 Transcript_29231/m.82481 type:complete len:589 (+) Transcript_29231:164-1930(+)|eukprot:CAMPEP_0117657624 /NCGR_PEP_ID=MMETSP0804-20121206/5430_1 /TAXON_ID=1074897 /ORGANISM="Tetraselmis astigmatica, Strain CCMP880" /LENGTH=588 /DNA_ID=CAMNT_0005464091 /DNA_START=63 /DNA_END=1829 /DNA_ORIENTATION=+